MLDSALRRAKDALLLPVARTMGRGVPPNLITLLGFGAGIGCAALLLRGTHAGALALWLVNRTLDGLDGTLARLHGRQSDFGGYLDLLLDFVLYALLPVCLVLGVADRTPLRFVALAALLGSFYVNAGSWLYLSAVLEKRSPGAAATSVAMPAGLIEGTETLLFFSLFMLLPGALTPLYSAMSALVLITAAQRLAWAARHL